MGRLLQVLGMALRRSCRTENLRQSMRGREREEEVYAIEHFDDFVVSGWPCKATLATHCSAAFIPL